MCSSDSALGPFEHAGGRAHPPARISSFFGVGHRHDPQREHFVDLGPVEEIAGALRRDLRVVVQDDRRRQHRVRDPAASPTSTGQRPACSGTLRLARSCSAGGSSSERTRLPTDLQNGVGRDERLHQPCVAVVCRVRRRERRQVGDVTRSLEQAIADDGLELTDGDSSPHDWLAEPGGPVADLLKPN